MTSSTSSSTIGGGGRDIVEQWKPIEEGAISKAIWKDRSSDPHVSQYSVMLPHLGRCTALLEALKRDGWDFTSQESRKMGYYVPIKGKFLVILGKRVREVRTSRDVKEFGLRR